MVLPCVFLGQLLLFIAYVYYSTLIEQRPRHSQGATAEQVPPITLLAEQPARVVAEASAPPEPAAKPTEAAAKAVLAAETAEIAETVGPRAAVAAFGGSAEEEDDEAPLEPEQNRSWAGLRGSCLEKAKGFWTYQLCVGEQVQQFHYTSSHGVAEQTRARLGMYAAALDAPLTQRYTEGDTCKLTKNPRETTVHYTCGQKDQLQRVEEPTPCVYELYATARAACEPAAEGLRDG